MLNLCSYMNYKYFFICDLDLKGLQNLLIGNVKGIEYLSTLYSTPISIVLGMTSNRNFTANLMLIRICTHLIKSAFTDMSKSNVEQIGFSWWCSRWIICFWNVAKKEAFPVFTRFFAKDITKTTEIVKLSCVLDLFFPVLLSKTRTQPCRCQNNGSWPRENGSGRDFRVYLPRKTSNWKKNTRRNLPPEKSWSGPSSFLSIPS